MFGRVDRRKDDILAEIKALDLKEESAVFLLQKGVDELISPSSLKISRERKRFVEGKKLRVR